MVNWLKKSKFSTYVLFGIAFSFSLISIFISIYFEMGTREFSDLMNLINREGTPGFAIVGIIVVLIVFYIIVQLFFGALISHLVARFIFRILIDFKTFYRVTLIFNSLMSLVIIWELCFYGGESSIVLILTNPILIISFIVLFLLLRALSNMYWLKPLLFTTFVFISYLAFSSFITLGG